MGSTSICRHCGNTHVRRETWSRSLLETPPSTNRLDSKAGRTVRHTHTPKYTHTHTDIMFQYMYIQQWKQSLVDTPARPSDKPQRLTEGTN